MSEQAICATAAISFARRVYLLVALVAAVASGTRAFFVVALVDLGVGITQLDGNVALELVLESDSLHAGNGLDDG